MGSHITDWHPGRVSKEYRENYDRVFCGKQEIICNLGEDPGIHGKDQPSRYCKCDGSKPCGRD